MGIYIYNTYTTYIYTIRIGVYISCSIQYIVYISCILLLRFIYQTEYFIFKKPREKGHKPHINISSEINRNRRLSDGLV